MADDQPLSFRPDQADPGSVHRLVEALDQQSGAPGVRRLRDWASDALTPQPGERVIDVGSGTGSETVALARLVDPNGEAIGVEPNVGLRSVAQQRAEQTGSSAHFVEGEADALPFEDASIDAVRCERVLQHLQDPARAVAEVARVLRPGGRVVLIDTDWATAALHPGDPRVVEAIMTAMRTRFVNPLSGRRLRGQLVAAGLVIDDVGSQALLQPQDAVDGPLLQMTIMSATAAGAITDVEGTRLLDDLRAAAAVGDFHMAVTMYAVLAHRPA